jgi:hypothetical protein
LRLAQPPANTMPKPNMSPPRTLPDQLSRGARYIDLESATTSASASACAPAIATVAASTHARKRRQSPNVRMSEIEPIVQKFVR